MIKNEEDKPDDKIKELERITSKVNYFTRNNILVHLKLVNDRWANGRIILLAQEFITLEEFKDGLINIFLVDIRDIEEYKPKIILKMEEEDNGK